VVPEGHLEATEHGLVPKHEGWFVLNATESRWRERPGRGRYCDFEGDAEFPQVGINIQVLQPGEPMAMYHWEADQEDFLVLSGDGILVIEGERRPLRQWDFVHCPAQTNHVIVAAGDAPLVVLAVGARIDSTGPKWGGYTVDETAIGLGAGVEQETNDPDIAYARFGKSMMTRYGAGWLPDLDA
jgi:mannose-6-phosphate isomerase-like protein (cupin superfamily)